MDGIEAKHPAVPGSAGEHALQAELGNERRALAFYSNQMLDHLNPAMQAFIAEQSMMFVASADGHGECDCSFRAGPAGFVRVVDAKRVLWPEYRGNGVTASAGNVRENGHLGLLLMDFLRDTVGLHINGKASMSINGDFPDLPNDVARLIAIESAAAGGKKPAFWFLVEVEEAYIHCAKHIPRFRPADKELDWGTDDDVKKGGDYFGVRAARQQARPPAGAAVDAAPVRLED
jgi:predicted pyridoxine 5'-phosphate oxidase superfamily flavin-nucleotide-binding protein